MSLDALLVTTALHRHPRVDHVCGSQRQKFYQSADATQFVDVEMVAD